MANAPQLCRVGYYPSLQLWDVPIFVDMQGFIIGGKFKVKEVAVLRRGEELTHHVFREPGPWSLLTKDEQQQANWLTANHHNLYWNDGDIDFRQARELIQHAVLDGLFDDDDDEEVIVYLKGLEKTTWLQEYLGDDHKCKIQNIEIDFEEIDRLKELTTTRSLRCRRHTKNCAMENVFKLYDWWFESKREIFRILPTRANNSDNRDNDAKKKPSTFASLDADLMKTYRYMYNP